VKQAGVIAAFGRRQERQRAPRVLSMLESSLHLIGGKVATMGLGFVFWLVAARLFSVGDVGLAAGAVSAVMLCTQLALVGIGSAVIVHFPASRQAPSRLLDPAFTVVAISGAAAAGVFVLVASSFFEELGVVASDPLFAAAFVLMSVLGTAGILFDQVSTALRRGDQALLRALAFGGLTVALLAAVATLTDAGGAVTIFSTWVGGALAACLLGSVQLRRSLGRYRYRPGLALPAVRRLLLTGLPNHALTLTERGPGLMLPIIVTELISPAANAAWYTAWMMAWVVFIIPIQVGMTTFAEVAHRPESLPDLVRHAIRSSVLLGGAAAVALAAVAPLVLSVLGSTYASAGATPLRILVFAVIPLTFVQAYFVTCRSTERLAEATCVGLVSGAVSVAGGALAATAHGLNGMAVVWLATQAATAVWVIWRLRRFEVQARGREVEISDSAPVPGGVSS
jgi:O-antigen/teichoic acid export membrane protein